MVRKRKHLKGSMSPHGRLVAEKDSADGTEAIRVADGQKRSSSADCDADGRISSTIEGPSPQGESNTLAVCKVLIHRLNLDGACWGQPTVPEGPETDVDCVAKDGKSALHIQVTRAARTIWRPLGQSGSVSSESTIHEAADELLERAKEKTRGLRPDHLSSIVLALDAMETPSYVLRRVVDDFEKRHGNEVRNLGFKEVWVVGPLEDLTLRLDP